MTGKLYKKYVTKGVKPRFLLPLRLSEWKELVPTSMGTFKPNPIDQSLLVENVSPVQRTTDGQLYDKRLLKHAKIWHKSRSPFCKLALASPACARVAGKRQHDITCSLKKNKLVRLSTKMGRTTPYNYHKTKYPPKVLSKPKSIPKFFL